jgi:hypothetical protein
MPPRRLPSTSSGWGEQLVGLEEDEAPAAKKAKKATELHCALCKREPQQAPWGALP